MAGKNTQEFNELNFDQEVLKSEIPVLVDFTATWCGPCKAIAPLGAHRADELHGHVKGGKVHIHQNPGLAHKYGIPGVPTLYVFKGGEVVGKMVGAAPKQNIAQLMQRAL